MNKTFTWRLLTPGELTDVYLQEMRRDFPAGELKPLSMILTSEAEGLAHTWGVFDGETLAAYLLMVRPEGSATCLYDCMKRAVLEMNVPLESAVRAASENPAKSIGIDNDYGSLAAGRYGNVILADKELNIQAVYQKGTRIV